MVTDDWVEFVKLILNHAGHGYAEYCSLVIPERKITKAEKIDKKMLAKYPEIGHSKDQRYRRKQAGQSNFAYMRWRNIGVILRTEGEVKERADADKFVRLEAEPLIFIVGSTVEIKVAKAKAGRKYTACLSRQSFRAIKGVLRDNIRHHRPEITKQYWERLQGLPAFSGILGQTGELLKWIRKECKLTGLKKWTGSRLKLRPL